MKDDGKTRRGAQPVSKSASKANGEYRFPGVPVGLYEIVVVSKNLNMAQKSVVVKLGHDHVQADDFVVESFSLMGKVEAANGSPLKDVTIVAKFVHAGEQAFKSKADGSYQIEKASSKMGALTLEASYPGYEFAVTTVEKLSPKSNLPTMKPAKYKVSGTVDRSGFDKEVTIKIAKKEDVLFRVVVDADGSYSMFLPAGQFEVSVEVSSSATIGKSEILFNKKTRENVVFFFIFQVLHLLFTMSKSRTNLCRA